MRSIILSVVFCLFGSLLAFAQVENQMIPLTGAEILQARRLSEFYPCTGSPDGKYLICSVRASLQKNGYDFQNEEDATGIPEYGRGGDLLLINLLTGQTRSITANVGSNWLPKWSPTGELVAFLSDRDGSGQARLWVWSPINDTLRRISSANIRAGWYLHGGQLDWTPEGRRLVVAIAPKSDCHTDVCLSNGNKHAKKIQSEVSPDVDVFAADGRATKRHVGTDSWNLDLAKRDLALMDVRDGSISVLMSGDRISSFEISPTGEEVAVTVPLQMSSPDSQQILFSVIAVNLHTLTKTNLAGNIKLDYRSEVSWSKDGTEVAFEQAGDDEEINDIFVASPSNPSRLRDITKFSGKRTGDANWRQSPFWGNDGELIYFLRNGALWKTHSSGGLPEEIAKIPGHSIRNIVSSEVDDDEVVVMAHDNRGQQDAFFSVNLKTHSTEVLAEKGQCFSCGSIGDVLPLDKQLIFEAEDADHPADLWLADPGFHKTRQLTRLNPALSDHPFGQAKLISWLDDDGVDLHGALLLPANYQPAKKYPLLVVVYGGSLLSSSLDEFGFQRSAPLNMQLLATRGYAVLLPDAPLQPGRQIFDLIKTVLPGVNKVVEMGIADSNRLAIMGHSNGGYSVLGLITATSRFRAAIDIAGPADLISMYGEMDNTGSAFGISVAEHQQGGTPWNTSLRFIENSPIFHFDRVNTPLLIIQGDEDHTVAPFLSEQVFVGLRRLGKPATYVKYHGEGHAPSAWSFANQIDLYQRITDWLETNLHSSIQAVGQFGD